MLSNSFSRVISHAREEYLYVYSVYVLEASTSNRLTHFYPPFNLLALLIFRPLRLFLPSNTHIRAARILLLKATHLPIVGAIMLYELVRGKVGRDDFAGFKGPHTDTAPPAYSSSSGNNNNGLAPRRKISRARMAMRPASSSSQGQQQQRQRQSAAAGRMSIGGGGGGGGPSSEPPVLPAARVASIRPFSASAADASIDDVDAPNEVEVKISELSGKIERLTEIILAMQSERERERDALSSSSGSGSGNGNGNGRGS